MADETMIETLTRLEATADVIKSLMDRVSDLEGQLKDYSDKSSETLKNLSWADELPDRLGKIEETSAPLKEGSTDLNQKLIEEAQNEKSKLDDLESAIKESETYFGIKN